MPGRIVSEVTKYDYHHSGFQNLGPLMYPNTHILGFLSSPKFPDELELAQIAHCLTIIRVSIPHKFINKQALKVSGQQATALYEPNTVCMVDVHLPAATVPSASASHKLEYMARLVAIILQTSGLAPSDRPNRYRLHARTPARLCRRSSGVSRTDC